MSFSISSVLDVFLFFCGLWALLYVVRWGINTVVPEAKGLIVDVKRNFGKKPLPKPASRKRVAQLEEGKVYHSKALDGRDQIISAKDDEDAVRVGAAALGVPEEEIVVAEVYDKVVSKRGRRDGREQAGVHEELRRGLSPHWEPARQGLPGVRR